MIKITEVSMIYRIIFFIIGILFCTNSTDYDPLKVYSFKLDNGLTVILNEDHNTTSVFGAIAVKGGGKREIGRASCRERV